MLDTAKSVIAGSLGVAAALLVLFIVGKATHPGAVGMGAVGDGLGTVIKDGLELLSSAVKAL